MFIKKISFKKDKWSVSYNSDLESGAKFTNKPPSYIQERFDSLESIYRQLFQNDYLIFKGYQFKEETKKKPAEVRIKFETSLASIPVGCNGSHSFLKFDSLIESQFAANGNHEGLERYTLATQASELIIEINAFCLDNIEAICVVSDNQKTLL